MRKILLVGLLISVLGFFSFISFYLYTSIETSTEKKAWEVHSKNVLGQINVLLKYNYRHQSLLRGFILTNDSVSYHRFITNGDDFEKSLSNLDTFVSQDAIQSAIVDSLKSLFVINNRVLDETLKSARDTAAVDQTIYNIRKGSRISKKIALLADEMIYVENENLVERDAAFTDSVNQSKKILVFLFVFFALFAIVIMIFLYINLSVIKRAKSKLEKKNALISKSKKQVEATKLNLEIISERFETSLNYSNVACFDWVDTTKKEFWVSDNLLSMLAMPRGEFVSTVDYYFSELLHPSDKDKVQKEMTKCLEKKIGYSVEYKLRTWSGEYRHFRSVGAVFSNNGVDRMTGVIINIDREIIERQTREEIIQNWQEFSIRFDLAMESSEYGVWDWYDTNSEHQWWSKTLYTLFGYDRSELTSTSSNLFSLIHPEDILIFKNGIQQNLEKSIQFNAEFRFRTKSYGYKWFRIVANKFNEQSTESNRMVGVISDISVEKDFLTELERSNQELENFAYVASHDLQEPLRKIQAFGDRLKFIFEQENQELPGKEFIEKMNSSATRMRVLIEDLLSYSRVSRELNYIDDFSLDDIILSVKDFISETIEEKEATIIIDGELPIMKECNKANIFQLFQNLISNAIKFQAPDVKPEVRISSKIISIKEAFEISSSLNRYDHYFYITVKDNGIGFDEKYLDKIFTIFQRLHGRHDYKGTGIGLALCKKICENHYGFITAKSQLNEGAEFIIIIPKVNR